MPQPETDCSRAYDKKKKKNATLDFSQSLNVATKGRCCLAMLLLFMVTEKKKKKN